MPGQIIRETPRQVHINGRYQTILHHRLSGLQYELFTTERSEPAVKSLKSGKTFFLTGSDLVDLAIAAGVDNDEKVPKRRKWPRHKPTPMKPLYECKPVPSQNIKTLVEGLVPCVRLLTMQEKLGNCVDYYFHLNRRVDLNTCTAVTLELHQTKQNIVVVDLVKDADLFAPLLQCLTITGNRTVEERKVRWAEFDAGRWRTLIVTPAMLPTERKETVVLHWVSLKTIPTNFAPQIRSGHYDLVLYHRHDTIFDRTSIKRNLALFQKPKETK